MESDPCLSIPKSVNGYQQNVTVRRSAQQSLPPPQAFLIVFFLAQRTIGRPGENKRARAGAGSEGSSSAGSDGKEKKREREFPLLPMIPCAPPH